MASVCLWFLVRPTGKKEASQPAHTKINDEVGVEEVVELEEYQRLVVFQITFLQSSTILKSFDKHDGRSLFVKYFLSFS